MLRWESGKNLNALHENVHNITTRNDLDFMHNSMLSTEVKIRYRGVMQEERHANSCHHLQTL